MLAILEAILQVAVAASLGAAVHFWMRASRLRLPPDWSYDVRPTLRALQHFARLVRQRGQLNARAGVCVAVAAFCQAGALCAFLILRNQF